MAAVIVGSMIAAAAGSAAAAAGYGALAVAAASAAGYAGAQSVMHGGGIDDFAKNFGIGMIGAGVSQAMGGMPSATPSADAVGAADMAGGLDPSFGSNAAYDQAMSGAVAQPGLDGMFTATETAPVSLENFSFDQTPQSFSVDPADFPSPNLSEGFGVRDVSTLDLTQGQTPSFEGMTADPGSMEGAMLQPYNNQQPTGMWDQARAFLKENQNMIGGGLKVAGGLNDLYQNKQNARMYQGNLDAINGMYLPGTPEYDLLKRQMEAQDAAKGRRSQYGTRLADLGAKTAQYRLQALSSPGYLQSMSGVAKSNAGAYAGIAAGLGTMFK